MAQIQALEADGSKQWVEHRTPVAGVDLVTIRAGTGKPLLVLHEELGYPGWLQWQSELARERSLLIAMHPGFGRTARLEWITSVRDLASFYQRFLAEQKLAPIDVIGFSLGGWIAAEMAVNNPAQFRRMVLVAPVGIRPPEGEILDLYNETVNAYLRSSVNDSRSTPEFARLFTELEGPEQAEAWEDARIQTARIAWKPYMYNPSLPYLLEGVAGLPAAIICGSEDRIVPRSAAQAYNAAIAGSRLVMIRDAGHRPEIEAPAEFVNRVREFLA